MRKNFSLTALPQRALTVPATSGRRRLAVHQRAGGVRAAAHCVGRRCHQRFTILTIIGYTPEPAAGPRERPRGRTDAARPYGSFQHAAMV